MSNLRMLLPALLLAGGIGPASAAARLPVAVLAVAPDAPPQPTSFPTRSDRTYTVLVSGVYMYDGRFGQADCGHKDPAGHQPWINEPNFTLDGSAARCVFLEFDDAHTYQWVQPGTGRPFAFDIPGGTYDTSDDVGALLVAVVENP